MTLGTLLFERNKVLLAPFAAVACGGLAASLFAAARGRPASGAGASSGGAPRSGRPTTATRPLAWALAMLFLSCAAVTVWHAAMLAASRRPALHPGLDDALAFLRDRTPQGAIVMTPWEHGYEVQTYARRATVMDGLIESAENQRRIVAFAEAAMSSAPDSLAALCARHRARWLLVPPSTQLHGLAVLTRAPFLAKLRPGIPLTRAEADRVMIQMMVLGRSYPGFEKVYERHGYRVYRVQSATAE
jgi:hypothetical protein